MKFLGKTWFFAGMLSTIVLLTMPSSAFCATLNVPSEYPTIQAAIDAAVDRDEIIVGDGTYYENTNFLGKAITVRSENGPFATIIDGGNSGTVVTFWNDEGADSVLDGFTITNGNGAWGGGICCFASEPTISNCIISGNTAAGGGGGIWLCDWTGYAAATITNCLITNNTSGQPGGGVYCGVTKPVIVNCTISSNSAITTVGGGIRSSEGALPTVVNSVLWGNSPDEISVSEGSSIDITYSDIEGGGWTGDGNIDCDPQFVGSGDYHLTEGSCCIDAGTSVGAPGYDIDGDLRPQGAGYDMGADEFVGLYYVPDNFTTIQEAIDAAEDGDEIIVRDGTYEENIDFLGKAITVRSENGPFTTIIDGGNSGTVVTFWNYEGADSVLDGFTITNGNGGFGGGIFCFASEATISNCIITGNKAGYGAGIFLCACVGVAPTITNCVISNNIAATEAGGVYCGSTSPTITNCTISENSAPIGGGIRSAHWCVLDASPTVVNSILWGNSPDEISLGSGGYIDITYSDIEGGWTGDGNMDCDPAFVGGGDYRLTAYSCCIDAGTSAGAPDKDIDGDPRPQGAGYDMGADEFGVVVILTRAIDTINGLDPNNDFKNKNMQNQLTNKINAVVENVNQGAYQEALDQLENDILPKIDGCAETGSPDKNDWITDCEAQDQVYPLITDAIQLLTSPI